MKKYIFNLLLLFCCTCSVYAQNSSVEVQTCLLYTSLFEATHDKKYQKLLDKRVLPGLEEYFDIQRTPNAYSSYIQTAPTSDRFYDDNVWLGIDFTDIYQITQEKR